MPISTIIYGAAIATNAVFISLAPTFYREIDHWHLPIKHPFDPSTLSRFSYREPQAINLQLNSGWRLELVYDSLTSFYGPNYPPLRHRAKAAEKAVVMCDDALRIARNTVALSGLPESVTWISLSPEVEQPEMPFDTFYQFSWYRPDEDNTATVDVAVDCRDGSVGHLALYCLLSQLLEQHSLARTNSEISPPPAEEIQREFAKQAAEDLHRWVARLPFPREFLDEDAVRRSIAEWYENGTNVEGKHWIAVLRSGDWRLDFRDGKLFGWRTPDAFFDSPTPPDLQRFTGQWRMSENQALAMVRKNIHDLGIHHEALKVILEKPDVLKPKLFGPPTVPRFLFQWQGGKRYLSSWIQAEVDADRKKVTRLEIYLWEEGTSRLNFK